MSESQMADRKRNPFIKTPSGGRALSALQLPFFVVHPPSGFGVLTTTGRRSGKKRRKCVRAIRRGDRVYLVAIKGRTAWLKNLEAHPEVRLRIRGGRFTGVGRRIASEERDEASKAYCETLNPFDYLEFMLWRSGRPSRSKVAELHRAFFQQGTPLVIELATD